jgi:hypothetical protein
MATNLHTQLTSFISPFLVSKFSKSYDESEALLKRSIETSISTILIGLDNKSEEHSLYDELLEYISKSEFYSDIDFGATKSIIINNSFNKEGHQPLNLIFSNKKERISEMISNEVGIKSETACAILNFSAMFVFSYLKKQDQNIKSLQSLLSAQRRIMLNTVPEGIRILLGVSTFEVIEDETQSGFASSIYNFFLGHFQF